VGASSSEAGDILLADHRPDPARFARARESARAGSGL
jgi:hypothetical protein